MSLHDVLRHLVQYGPGRNEDERAQLLGLIDEDEKPAPAPADPDPAAPKTGGPTP